jgi:hypothetical protein
MLGDRSTKTIVVAPDTTRLAANPNAPIESGLASAKTMAATTSVRIAKISHRLNLAGPRRAWAARRKKIIAAQGIVGCRRRWIK